MAFISHVACAAHRSDTDRKIESMREDLHLVDKALVELDTQIRSLASHLEKLAMIVEKLDRIKERGYGIWWFLAAGGLGTGFAALQSLHAALGVR